MWTERTLCSREITGEYRKEHPFGENGEHAHDYDWDAEIPQGSARELTEEERIQHADILLERKKRKEKHL